MIASHHDQNGMTLLELILVLALAVAIILMSMNLASQFREQTRQAQITADVNQLFQAMSHYYQANCRSGASLAANANSPAVLTINSAANANDLVHAQYLSSWKPITTSIIDENAGKDLGYFVQLEKILSNGADYPMSIYACTGTAQEPQGTAQTCSTVTLPAALLNSNSKVIIWRAHVAVKLRDDLSSADHLRYKQVLGATCLANDPRATCVDATSGSYLVWERLGSPIAPSTGPLWMSQPNLKQFNMQYSNDGMAALSGITWDGSQNYLCGE